jgi:hypothetical protein
MVREHFAPKIDEHKVVELRSQIESVNLLNKRPKVRRIKRIANRSVMSKGNSVVHDETEIVNDSIADD